MISRKISHLVEDKNLLASPAHKSCFFANFKPFLLILQLFTIERFLCTSLVTIFSFVSRSPLKKIIVFALVKHDQVSKKGPFLC